MRLSSEHRQELGKSLRDAWLRTVMASDWQLSRYSMQSVSVDNMCMLQNGGGSLPGF